MNIFFASLSKGSSKPYLVIINGESNSGGYALNSEAPSGELGVRSSVSILNPVSLVFESLSIGGNNLLDHTGLSNGVTHGFELELANRADTVPKYSNVKLIKTGHGGSTIGQWNVGGSYFTKFSQRIAAAKTFIDFADYNIVILFSLGINDAGAGTNINTWKTGVTNHFAAMRSEIGFGDVPIAVTQFQGMGNNAYGNFNIAIQELANTLTNIYPVDVTGAGLRDPNHWNYSGMKLVSGRLLDQVIL